MTRLLVTGASGLLGTHLLLEASDQVDVIAVSHQLAISSDTVQSVQTDLIAEENVQELFERFSPDWVVNCAALTDVDACEDDLKAALALNRDLPERLAQFSRVYGAKYIHISTDAVFDGVSGKYSEEDPPSPINRYGFSKLEGERAVLASNPQALILRTNFFGWSAGSKVGLFEWFYQRLESETKHPGFIDVKVSLISSKQLASWILKLFQTRLNGIYHLASSDCISKFEFGRMIAEEFGFSTDFIHPISVEDAGLRVTRPKNLCLDTTKFSKELDVQLPKIRDGVRLIRKSMEDGYRERLQDLF